MNNYSGISGNLYRVTEWIMKFSIINLIWLFFNIPIIFLLLNILLVEQVESLFTFIIPLVILLPLLFFPATMAMFATVREWIIKEKDSGRLVRSYWRHYKNNYKRSLQGGVILTALWLVWGADIYFLSDKGIIFRYLFIIIGLILFVLSINFFSITVHYHMNLRTSLKSAFLITITSPVLFIIVILCSGIALYISLSVFRFLLLLFTGSVIAFLSFSVFNRYYLKPAEVRKIKDEIKKT